MLGVISSAFAVEGGVSDRLSDRGEQYAQHGRDAKSGDEVLIQRLSGLPGYGSVSQATPTQVI